MSDTWTNGMIVVLILDAIALIMLLIVRSCDIHPERNTKRYARALLVTIGTLVFLPLWPITVLLVAAGILRWSWLNADISIPSRQVRREVRRRQRQRALDEAIAANERELGWRQ